MLQHDWATDFASASHIVSGEQSSCIFIAIHVNSPSDCPYMMFVKAIIAAIVSATFVAAQSDSEIVGVFILGRHGDRTSKIQGLGIEGNSVLTTLGKNQVFESGTYFRNYYLNSSGPNFIQGVNSNYQINQIYASAPYHLILFLGLIAAMTMYSFRLRLGSGKECSLLRTLPPCKLLRMERQNLPHSTDINMSRSTVCLRHPLISFGSQAIKHVPL